MMAMHYRQHHQRQQHLQSLAIKRSLDSQSNGSGAHGVGGARGVSSGISGLHHGGHDHHDCVNGECDDEDEDLDEEEIYEEDEEHIMNRQVNYFGFISGLDRKLGLVGFEVCELFREIVVSSIKVGVKCDKDDGF